MELVVDLVEMLVNSDLLKEFEDNGEKLILVFPNGEKEEFSDPAIAIVYMQGMIRTSDILARGSALKKSVELEVVIIEPTLELLEEFADIIDPSELLPTNDADDEEYRGWFLVNGFSYDEASLYNEIVRNTSSLDEFWIDIDSESMTPEEKAHIEAILNNFYL